ncbi:MAG: hypothetical protein OEY86_05080 [Nitrospira sp.]|nr:hypothetical protein [Nitrospira sp.]
MRLTNKLLPGAVLFCLVAVSPIAHLSEAGNKTSGTILVQDALTTPGQPTRIEVRLSNHGLLTTKALGGEPLDLLVNGEIVGTGMTGGDGRAFLPYRTKTQGVIPIHVRVGTQSRVSTKEGVANLAVWEQRNPIVVIELTALMKPVTAKSPSPDIDLQSLSQQKPLPDAAGEIAKLTQFYYRVIYVVSLPSSATDRFRATVEARAWLKVNDFPPGYILMLPPGEETLGAKIDELHQEGWKTIKVGVGRSKAFAEAFLKRRLEAVMLLKSTTDSAPRRAKIAKDWKEVRKQL